MYNNEQAIRKAMEFARSEQGKQLLQLLQNSHSDTLNQAMQYANRGDYAAAQQILSKLLSDPQAKNLMNNPGG